MAEVVDYQVPRPTEAAPPWLLGQVDWENRQVPVFSFGALVNGSGGGEVTDRSKIMVLKSLTDSTRVPYTFVCTPTGGSATPCAETIPNATRRTAPVFSYAPYPRSRSGRADGRPDRSRPPSTPRWRRRRCRGR